MPATANADGGSAGQIEHIPGPIADRELSFHPNGAVIVNGDFCQTILLYRDSTTLT
jgi:hypothetical protein